MASPESSTSTPESTGFDSARAMAELASTRAEEATKMGRTDHLEKQSFTEEVYQQRETDRIVESVRADVESDPSLTKADLIGRAAERLMAGRLRLATEDLDAHRAKLEGEGKGAVVRFFDKYRHSRKARLTVAAASLGGAVVLAGFGMWIPALAVKAGSGVLRAGATYLSAREGIDKAAMVRDSRRERKLGPVGMDAGRLNVPEGDTDELLAKARELSSAEAIRRLAMFESPHIQHQRPESGQERDQAWKEALRQVELDRIRTDFMSVLDRTHEGKSIYFKKDVPDALKGMISASLSNSLAVRREQIADDKRSRNLRKGLSMGLAAVAGASGFAGFMIEGAEHSKHIMSATKEGIANYKERILHWPSGPVAPHAGEIHAPAAHHTLDHTGGTEAPVPPSHELADFQFEAHSGDSYWSAGEAAMNHLDKVDPSARHLGHARRLLANDYMKDWLLRHHGGNSLVNTGDRIKIPHAVMKNAVSYARNYKF